MATVQLMQSDLTYNVTAEDGKEYTVLIMEDLFSGYFSTDILDNNGEMIDDEEKIIEISNLIESKRD